MVCYFAHSEQSPKGLRSLCKVRLISLSLDKVVMIDKLKYSGENIQEKPIIMPTPSCKLYVH